MGTSALLSLGMRAMFANQASLLTIGQNLSNANTPGYSRQQVVLSSAAGEFTGAGFFGKGVNVDTVTRSYNAFLTRDAAVAKSNAAMDSTRYAQLQQLERLLPPGESGPGYAANQLFNAMVDVSANPSDPSARQVVLGRAQELAARFSSSGQRLADLQTGVVSDLKANVDVVNQLAKQIAKANEQIARVTGSGHTPNDLLDQRDQLISELSSYVKVSTLPASDGTMGVFIGGGQRLVLGSIPEQLAVTPDPYDSSRAQLSMLSSSGKDIVLNENLLTGGSISALLAYQNKDLQDARNLLGQMAMAFSERVNLQQSLGLDLSSPSGLGVPIFAAGEPRSLPARTNARNPDGTFVTNVSVAITDATRLPAASFELRSDPASGGFQLSRRPDGQPEILSAADIETRYGFSVTVSGGAMAPTDSYVIEPVGQAAVGMRRILDNPNGIAAASPVTAYTSIKNTGTASVESLYAVNSNIAATVDTAAPRVPLQIVFGTVNADSSINYTVTMADGSVITDQWTSGEKIGNFPLAGIDLGFELRLNGVPHDGDVIDITKTDFPASNNGNAKAFLNMQGEQFVGRTVLADGSVIHGSSITDAYAEAMSDIGSRVQGAQYLSSASTAVANDAEQVRSGASGVNLDEEASRLMQFQQGYQAAAKVLQVGQTLFDELLKLSQR